ncbi:MAG: polysaccharide biosynthesis/export family protein [Desulfobacteraceae bacterium]|nr:polysaccharide biosynthesis/export family protein [Desulfobacteraceae bacterium]
MFINWLNKSLQIFSIFLLTLVLLSNISFAEGNTLIKKYRIGAGDELNINVWKEADLNLESARVRIDGKVTFPLLGDLQAAGLTPMELKDKIEIELSKFVESPTVTVTLLNSGSQRFYILGEVTSTGEYPILKNLTVMQAFALAGGFTEWASKKEILLFRNENNKKITIKIDYRDILKGDFSKNIPIQADDTLIVP